MQYSQNHNRNAVGNNRFSLFLKAYSEFRAHKALYMMIPRIM
ncbi:unnamed protein product [Haemonchus placei]|uniref:Uncharacterized protein n=1 Tax=Haemonchus placei TaxID=6290 RepID=A0A3P7SPW8_HAEPC|nr:unnamed protein product [Haemonchus placei]